MKKLFFNILLLFLFPLMGMAEDGFVINGNVTGVISGTVAITRFIHLNANEQDDVFPAKVRIQNGRFTFAGKLAHSALVELKVSTRVMVVYLENKRYTIDCTFDSLSDAQLKGGQANDDWVQFFHAAKPSMQFIASHPNSEVAAYLAWRDHTARLSDADSARALLSPAALQTWPGQQLDATIAELRKASAGNSFPDLQLADPDHKPLAMKDFAGKVVVLDFWASWCGPCRAYIPTLRQHYQKYKDKGVQFMSVSVDDEPGKWYTALKELHMEWPQVLAAGGFKDGAGVKELLHIYYIPHVIIVGKDGRIAANMDYSQKDQLEKKLDELLQ